jgi:DNA-binding LytR/AlgR family response regulator
MVAIGQKKNYTIGILLDKKIEKIEPLLLQLQTQIIAVVGEDAEIIFSNENILSHEKISYFENFLKDKGFLRVHKSFVIAVDRIKFIEGNRIKVGNQMVPIGQTYKSNFNKVFNN